MNGTLAVGKTSRKGARLYRAEIDGHFAYLLQTQGYECPQTGSSRPTPSNTLLGAVTSAYHTVLDRILPYE